MRGAEMRLPGQSHLGLQLAVSDLHLNELVDDVLRRRRNTRVMRVWSGCEAPATSDGARRSKEIKA